MTVRVVERMDATAAGQPTIDAVAFEELRSLGDAFVADLLAGFTAETEPLVAELREAFDLGRSSDTARLCHAIKGACGQVGARRLLVYCNRLERWANLGDLQHGESELISIEAEYAVLRQRLAWQLEPAG